MLVKELFEIKKKPFGLKLGGHQYLQVHEDFNNVVYFAREYDENNIELACMRVHREKGFFKYVFDAGSNILVLDKIMIKELQLVNEFNLAMKKYEEDKTKMPKPKRKIVGIEGKDMFTTKIPEEFKANKTVKKYLNNDYSVLYVKNNAIMVGEKNKTVTVVFTKNAPVKDHASYILFKSVDFIEKRKGGEYFEFETTEVQVPTFLLK